MSTHRYRGQRGFTLLELMVVGVLLTLLAAITIPRMSFVFNKDELRTSTTTITSSLYMARMKAVNDGEPFGIRINPAQGTVLMLRDPLINPVQVGPVSRIEDGVMVGEITFTNNLVVFTEFGQVDPVCFDGSGSFTGHIKLFNGIGDSTRVEVTMVTGRIRENNL